MKRLELMSWVLWNMFRRRPDPKLAVPSRGGPGLITETSENGQVGGVKGEHDSIMEVMGIRGWEVGVSAIEGRKVDGDCKFGTCSWKDMRDRGFGVERISSLQPDQ